MVTHNSAAPARSRTGVGAAVALIAGSLLLCLLFMEIVLRAMPSLIGVPLLAYFPAPLRHEIADRLGLPSINKYVVIEPSERADKGPPLYHPAPNSVFVTLRDPVDLALGATDAVPRDARGFCNPPEKGTRERFDIVVVGDSFTACTGVRADQTATFYLEEMGPYSVYNLGVGNIGLYEYVELLRRYGIALKPRLVIMNIYEGNDLRDAVRYHDFVASGRDRRAGKNALEETFSLSYAASFLYAAVDWLQTDWKDILGLDTNFLYSAQSEGRAVPMNITNRDLDEVTNARKLQNGEISVELWRPPLEAFQRLGREHGFIPVVTYTPSMYTAYAETVTFEDPETGRVVKHLSDVQRAWLAKTVPKMGMAYLDLTPAFQAAAKSGPLTHFPANVHLTPLGMKLSAQEWKRWVEPMLAQSAN